MVSKKGLRIIDFGSDNRGSVAIEAAVMIPLILIVVLSATDLSFAILAQHQAVSAAHAGLLYASAHGTAIDNASGQIQAACQYVNSEQGSKKGYVSVSCAEPTIIPCGCAAGTEVFSMGVCTATTLCSSGSTPGVYVTQQATATYTPIMSYSLSFLGGPTTFTSTATARVW